ncbi:hypothetical protein CWE04_01680 [Thomasclavelia cocleata]|jgi:chaperonin cofactor prefoldin|uniref:Uncharacterized protein n=1 Tax=Thomasclavelia cocleata TaxID=69824 RepID=A0A1I0D1G9_9FIRM|nr:hypothetical protein [Thomasclavelia cocleata]MCR1959743.1 hypothetical protein [Thomasclavelia cocleata]NDO41069.1 hypothetical protein [Thomasclavelia cocleata]PJN81595.1 hypothetical protein CWE04_01680 [Thomasclavelia cocleata]SET25277.1 hypothetical protein SAMN04489758_10483 [Thomasclavelia cocleata]
MKLFRSENEVLQDDKEKQQIEKEKQQLEKEKQEAEKKLREFYKDIDFINSKEEIEFLEKTRNFSKLSGKHFYTPDLSSGEFRTYYAVAASVFLDFYILDQLSNSRKSIDTLVKQNKELNAKLEDKLDTLIEQNKELNNKFDQLIEILKSK